MNYVFVSRMIRLLGIGMFFAGGIILLAILRAVVIGRSCVLNVVGNVIKWRS